MEYQEYCKIIKVINTFYTNPDDNYETIKTYKNLLQVKILLT